MTYHYGRAFHPLLASAAAFYVPLLSALAIGRRSWIDILVVGAVLVILAGLLDGLAFPVGTYGIIILHVAWSIGTIVSILRQPTKPNE